MNTRPATRQPAAAIVIASVRVHGIEATRLTSPHVEALVLDGKGAELHSFKCRATGVEMLAQEPDAPNIANRFRKTGALGYGDCYLGGWPSLLPSRARRGDEIIATPANCGEAASVPFAAREMLVAGRPVLSCTTDLPRSNLRVTRTFRFDSTGRSLEIRASVTNIAASSIKFHWTEHPTFGGDLLAGDFELLLPGCDTLSDGELVSHGDRRLADLRVASGEADLFWTLRCLSRPWAAVFDASRNVGVHLAWDGRRFPHAWYWQSLRDGRRSLAIEPTNSFLTELSADRDDALALRLDAGESASVRMSLSLIDAQRTDVLRGSLIPRREIRRRSSSEARR